MSAVIKNFAIHTKYTFSLRHNLTFQSFILGGASFPLARTTLLATLSSGDTPQRPEAESAYTISFFESFCKEDFIILKSSSNKFAIPLMISFRRLVIYHFLSI